MKALANYNPEISVRVVDANEFMGIFVDAHAI